MNLLTFTALLCLLLAFIVSIALWSAHRETARENAILGDLLFHTNAYGIEIVKRNPKLLRRGTIYVTLGRLEQDGLVASKEEALLAAGCLPRRLYSITDAGRDEALSRARAK